MEKLNYDISSIESEKKSIESYLTNFHDFHDLLKIRRNIRKEREKQKLETNLGEFYILNGRYHIDQFAQILKVTDGLKELKKYFDIPLVLTDREFWDIVEQYGKRVNSLTKEERKLDFKIQQKLHESGRPYPLNISMSFTPSLPGKKTICPHCGLGWDLSNVDDCLRHSSTWESFPIIIRDLYNVVYNFEGQPLKQFWDFIQLRNDAIYYPQEEYGINNLKWIDLNPNPEYPTLKINENGWVSKDKIDENYILQKGDNVNFQVVKCYHKNCNRDHLNKMEEEKFNKCFIDAGFENFKLIPIPNEYCHDIENCTICSNWFNVSTKWGVIKIGWRKRVINIDWSNTIDHFKCNGNEIFLNEDTTKDKNFVHAWGYDKCTEYLTILRKEFEKL